MNSYYFCIRSFIKTGMVWMDIKTFTCSTSQELKHRFVRLTVYFSCFTPLEVLIEMYTVLSAVFVRAGTQSFCWDRRALECVFLCSRWWWWRARPNRQPSASWELYVFLWVLSNSLSITQRVLQRDWCFSCCVFAGSGGVLSFSAVCQIGQLYLPLLAPPLHH